MNWGVGAIGPAGFEASYGATVTPLEQAATKFSREKLALLVAIGATTAMLGVLLNLILGLSRVALAMGRQGDLPPIFAKVTPNGNAPYAAVLGVGVAVGSLTLIGSIETTWAFSALPFCSILH